MKTNTQIAVKGLQDAVDQIISLRARVAELECENAAMKEGEYYLDALRYLDALERIEAQWNRLEGDDVDPSIMANIAIYALHS